MRKTWPENPAVADWVKERHAEGKTALLGCSDCGSYAVVYPGEVVGVQDPRLCEHMLGATAA